MPEIKNEILTLETFSYSKIKVGNLVCEEVVQRQMSVIQPACMRSDCAQMGEPYADMADPRTGFSKPTFPTFKAVAGSFPERIWEFCGYCFQRENEPRGIDLKYC